MLCTVSSSVPNPIPALLPAAYFPPYGVTGTLTASNWADQSGNGHDFAQGSAGNQPIYLPYTGTAYAWLPGAAGNYLSTPNAAANRITGDIDILVKVAMDDWTPSAQQVLVSKFNTGDARSYELRITTGGNIALGWTPGADAAILTATSTVATGITDATAKWVRATLDVDNGASGYTATFYTSDDGSTWTMLGTAVTGVGATSIAAASDPVYVGARPGGSIYSVGKFYRAQIYNGINGTLAVDFNPADFAETSTNGATAVSSGTGETWTLNSTAVYNPAQIVKSASLVGGGDARWMATAGFTLNGVTTAYVVARANTWVDAHYLLDGVSINTFELGQFAGSTPEIAFRGPVCSNNDLAIGTKGVITAVDNGTSSLIQINAETAATGTHTTGNKGGLTLFNYGGGGAGANIGAFNAYEVIVFNAAHDAVKRYTVQRYLNTQHRCF